MSGGTPKKPGVLKKIVINLGPVFTTEMFILILILYYYHYNKNLVSKSTL